MGVLAATSAPPRLRRAVLLVNADLSGMPQLRQELRRHDLDLLTCLDGAEALLSVGEFHPDLLVLGPDVRLVDGPTLVAMVRSRYRMSAMVVGSASPGPYVAEGAIAVSTWPPSAAQLAAVASTGPCLPPVAVPAAAPLATDAVLRAGNIVLDLASLVVTVSGRRVHLPLREFRLLAILMHAAGRVVPYRVVKDTLWGLHTGDVANTMSVHIRRLRHRIGDDPTDPQMLITVRGVGYRLDLPLAEASAG